MTKTREKEIDCDMLMLVVSTERWRAAAERVDGDEGAMVLKEEEGMRYCLRRRRSAFFTFLFN